MVYLPADDVQYRTGLVALVRAERSIERAVLDVVDDWLEATRFVILRELAQQMGLTAAGDHADAVDAATAAYDTWRKGVNNRLVPEIGIAFGEAYRQIRHGSPPQRYETAYLETVVDRLVAWPAGAMDDVRAELVDALQSGEDYKQMGDKIGAILGMDGRTRQLRAEISYIEHRLQHDDTLTAGERKELAAARRELWREHDEALGDWQWKARRIARTEAHAAQEYGKVKAAQDEAFESGQAMWKRWRSARDTQVRASHRVADGQCVKLVDRFRVGGVLLEFPGDPAAMAPQETIQCFPADTRIDAPGLEASVRTPYEGPLVTVSMASGGVLTGSPNHPVLTERGWVRLGELKQGDGLIRAALGELDLRPRRDPDEQRVPTTIGEVHRALDQASLRKWVGDSMVDFYGDRPSGEVEVVAANRELRDRLDTAHREKLAELGFEGRDAVLHPLSLPRSPFEFGFAAPMAADGVVGGGNERSPLVGGSALHTREHGVTSVPGCDTAIGQPAADHVAADSKRLSDRLLRLSGEVAAHDDLGVEHYASIVARLPRGNAGFAQSLADQLGVDSEVGCELCHRLASGESTADLGDIDGDACSRDLATSADRDTFVLEDCLHCSGRRTEVGGDGLHRLSREVAPGDGLDVHLLPPLAGETLDGAELDARLGEPVADGLPGYPELLADLGGALAGLVEPDQVVGIDVRSFRGHLYTVQTSSGMYLASSYIVRNCRCISAIYSADQLQDGLQGPDGSIGEVKPGGVRIGPDDPDAADKAIDQAADDLGQPRPPKVRGEDAGQAPPDPVEPVPLTEERAAPLPDLSGVDDDELAELLAKAHDARDDDLYEWADAEWERRNGLPDDDADELADGIPGDIPVGEFEQVKGNISEMSNGSPSRDVLGGASPDDAEALAAHLDATMPGDDLTEDEQAAVLRWQGMDRFYQQVQRELRGEGGSEEAEQVVDVLDGLIDARPLDHEIVVWRGIRNAQAMFGIGSDDLESAVGQTIPPGGFIATSTSRDVAVSFTDPGRDPVILRLSAAAGTRVLWVAGAGDQDLRQQQELLFGASALYIVGVSRTADGFVQVDVEMR